MPLQCEGEGEFWLSAEPGHRGDNLGIWNGSQTESLRRRLQKKSQSPWTWVEVSHLFHQIFWHLKEKKNQSNCPWLSPLSGKRELVVFLFRIVTLGEDLAHARRSNSIISLSQQAAVLQWKGSKNPSLRFLLSGSRRSQRLAGLQRWALSCREVRRFSVRVIRRISCRPYKIFTKWTLSKRSLVSLSSLMWRQATVAASLLPDDKMSLICSLNGFFKPSKKVFLHSSLSKCFHLKRLVKEAEKHSSYRKKEEKFRHNSGDAFMYVCSTWIDQ